VLGPNGSDSLDPVAPTTRLRSSSGDFSFTLCFEEETSYATDAGFVASIQLAGNHFDGDHTHPWKSEVGGLWVRRDDLVAMRHVLGRWVARPIDKLDPRDLSCDFEMARLPDQSVRVAFQPQSDRPLSRNPVAVIDVAAGSMSCRVVFETDQSCLNIFQSELRAVLGA